MALASLWRRRVLGPDEHVHARKERGSRTRVCDVPKFYYDGYVMRTIRRNARHWFGNDIKNVTCPLCRYRLDLPVSQDELHRYMSKHHGAQ